MKYYIRDYILLFTHYSSLILLKILALRLVNHAKVEGIYKLFLKVGSLFFLNSLRTTFHNIYSRTLVQCIRICIEKTHNFCFSTLNFERLFCYLEYYVRRFRKTFVSWDAIETLNHLTFMRFISPLLRSGIDDCNLILSYFVCASLNKAL